MVRTVLATLSTDALDGLGLCTASSNSRAQLVPSPRAQLLLQEGAAREPGLGEHLVVERSAVEGPPGVETRAPEGGGRSPIGASGRRLFAINLGNLFFAPRS